MELNNKTIAITGAGRGLGRAMAEALARKGARLALVEKEADRLRAVTKALHDAGASVADFEADVADESSVTGCFEAIAETLGPVDGLINNAGITRDGLLVKAKAGKVLGSMSLEDWQSVLSVDLRGVFLCGRAAAQQMIDSGLGGVIINVSSISRAGNFGQSNYSAAKAGVAAMTVTWAKELIRHRIRVAAIAPGFCNTPMVSNMPDKALERVRNSIPMKRLGEPAEIAHGALFILENDYYTGRVLEIDGGLRL